jgi:hypothetical protein
MKVSPYIADELANKVYHLHQALEQSKKIISILELENQNLKDLLSNMYPENTKYDIELLEGIEKI